MSKTKFDWMKCYDCKHSYLESFVAIMCGHKDYKGQCPKKKQSKDLKNDNLIEETRGTD